MNGFQTRSSRIYYKCIKEVSLKLSEDLTSLDRMSSSLALLSTRTKTLPPGINILRNLFITAVQKSSCRPKSSVSHHILPFPSLTTHARYNTTMSTSSLPSNMKEARVYAGQPVTVQIHSTPVPKPEADQVLIRVHVSGTNPKDWKVSLRSSYSFSVHPIASHSSLSRCKVITRLSL